MFKNKTENKFFLSKKVMIEFGVLVIAVILLGTILSSPQYIAPTEVPEFVKPRVSPMLFDEFASNPNQQVGILVETYSNDYSSVIEMITQLGGIVTHQYSYTNGLAAKVSGGAVLELGTHPDVSYVSFDTVRFPDSSDLPAINREEVNALDIDMKNEVGFELDTEAYELQTLSADNIDDITPSTYMNPVSMEADLVWEQGNWGQGSLAVIIDTGIYSGHFMLSGSVVGGVDLSSDVGYPEEGYDRIDNHYHGTHVAGILAGHGAIIVPNDDPLALSIEYNTGEDLEQFDANNKLIYLMGMAPEADIYAVKVFPKSGAGAPESTIIAGIEHAIALKLNGEYDVDSISMSLGG
jgi:subtilisin family serine protease